jgi:hypothetical protein
MGALFDGAVMDQIDPGAISTQIVANIRRSALARGLMSFEEAEFLFTMDRAGQVGGPEWLPVAVKAVTDFLVWEHRPTGHLMESDADWLIGMVGDCPTAFGRAVAFAVVQEAESVPPRLSELVMRAAVGRCLLV